MDNSFEQGKTKGSERRWEVVAKMQGRDGSMGVMKRRGEFRVIATMHVEWWLQLESVYQKAVSICSGRNFSMWRLKLHSELNFQAL